VLVSTGGKDELSKFRYDAEFPLQVHTFESLCCTSQSSRVVANCRTIRVAMSTKPKQFTIDRPSLIRYTYLKI